MKKLIFKNPLNGKPYSNSQNLNISPNCVYIYGVLNDVDGEQKFIPLNVGETTKGINRLNQHFNSLVSKKYRKEIFNLEKSTYILQEIISIYSDMLIYDRFRLSNHKKGKNQAFSNHFPILMSAIESLLYFQDMAFYDTKTNSNTNSSFSLHGNKDIDDALILLNQIGNPIHQQIANKLQHTIKNITANFYFIYADEYLDDEGQLHSINPADTKHFEALTKKALSNIGIHTTSPCDSSDLKNEHIDLSCIQNILINVGNHCYGCQKYIQPLVI